MSKFVRFETDETNLVEVIKELSEFAVGTFGRGDIRVRTVKRTVMPANSVLSEKTGYAVSLYCNKANQSKCFDKIMSMNKKGVKIENLNVK